LGKTGYCSIFERLDSRVYRPSIITVTMNILSFHKNLISKYKSYINSFIHIKSPDILQFVNDGINSNKLWREPLIQFNPTFQKGSPINSLIERGNLHPEMNEIFADFELYRHQEEAIELGSQGKEFVVTSGTGSGKSLTYIATIFNHILKSKQSLDGKIQAVIVYPMNALINSQFNEISKYKEQYEKQPHKTFGIEFAQYTGQEGQEERDELRRNPPHILLTNYVMLEYLMTRGGDDVELRKNILANIQFLVFDELHTYRGRQGADVSLLIRRIKAQASGKVNCIGTSATMVSGDDVSITAQREIVASIASTIFGSTFKSDQVIIEYLVRSLEGSGTPSKEDLFDAINKADINKGSHADFERFPTANWLEENIALERKEGQFVRRKPITLIEMGEALALASGQSQEKCIDHLTELLNWANELNTSKPSTLRKNYLPYRIHQFISQTGTVYSTLGTQNKRDFQLEAGLYAENRDIHLFPLVFSRESGHEFYCVTLDQKSQRVVPMEFYNIGDDEDEEDANVEGYIFIQHMEDEEQIWNPERDVPELPDAWFNKPKKDGTRTLKNNYIDRIPRKIFFDRNGNFSFTIRLRYEGWFIAKPLVIDPTSGLIFSDRNEWRKLARLGGEGRSTATTVLSFETIVMLQRFKQSNEQQKLLSFTDNRQDASLQAGHFNDFVKVGQLRAAINKAIQSHSSLDYSNIKETVFECLNIDQSEYARNPATFPGPKKENEDAFKDYIFYKIIHDLRRSWRVVLPNLEQCGLLSIKYKFLTEAVQDASLWKQNELLDVMSATEREEFLFQIFEFFRKAYALSFSMLEPAAINKNTAIIKEKLKQPWTIDEADKIEYTNVIRIEKLSGAESIYSETATYGSAFGRFLRKAILDYKVDITGKTAYDDFTYRLFDFLVEAGWLTSKTVRGENRNNVKVYQLKLDNILWQPGDGVSVAEDQIKVRSYKGISKRVNKYFQEFYTIQFKEMKPIEGAEHTGQINSDSRKDRELAFRKGEISTLFCSPTMELGIDISDLSIVHMRNVPPSPANYAQRSGRAGRSGQAALVMVYCSNFNPHDRYYFKNATKMVAGSVTAPRLDLVNEELLQSHLNSMILTRRSLNSLKNSLGDLVDKDDANRLPFRPEIVSALTLTEDDKKQILEDFKKVVTDNYFTERFQTRAPKWYNEDWIRLQIENFFINFDRSMNRWRDLYRSALSQFKAANEVIENKIYGANHEKVILAKRQWSLAVKQMDLLLNQSSNPKNTSKQTKSDQAEFYPYRYLASEGFLPGYGFTRLPIRTFLEKEDKGGGEFVSRARYIGLGEFGPKNVIYHDGSKYRIDQIILTDAEAKLEQAKISPTSGYIMMKDQFSYQVDPINSVELSAGMDDFTFMDFVEMPESRARELQRITCQEEERNRKGFKIDTYFSLDSGFENVVEAHVLVSNEKLLHIHSMPSARLVHVNFKAKASPTNGFALNLKNGFWQTKAQEEDDSKKDDIKRVKLYTTNTANALYMQPVEALGLDGGPAGAITLMYALKRAIETVFQVESSEIGVTAIGNPDNPNILLYEASEGSLGVLSQIVENPELYRAVMNEAYRVCFIQNEVEIEDKDLVPATYDDLLSYYNQTNHAIIDRKLIRSALRKLKESAVEIIANSAFSSYEDQYTKLQMERDPSSSTEDYFLKYLKKHSLRLPDEAQPVIPNMFVRPDFFYKPNVVIFCDGTPHDDPKTAEDDLNKRKALKTSGYQVLAWHYKDDLDEFVSKRPDIFKKVKG
jgi:superfamily II DNA/RNA helicase